MLPSGDQAAERSIPSASSGSRCRPRAVHREERGRRRDDRLHHARERDPPAVRRERGHRVERAGRQLPRRAAARGDRHQAHPVGAPVRQVPLEDEAPAARRPDRPGVAAERLPRRRHRQTPQAAAVGADGVEARQVAAHPAEIAPEGDPARGAVAPPAPAGASSIEDAASAASTRRIINRAYAERTCGKIPRNARKRALRVWLRRAFRGRPRAARRQGRRPRRDDAARRSRAVRLHDHDRRLPGLHGERPAAARTGCPRRSSSTSTRSSSRPASASATRRTRCSSRSARAPRSRCPG